MDNKMKKLNGILLVDDDDVHNYINKKIIEHTDITNHIEVAANGQDALNYLNRCVKYTGKRYQYPNLIFLDINIPIMDGWKFVEEYKQLKKDANTKTVMIMLTTSCSEDDRLRAESLPDISRCIQKPLSIEIVKKIIQEHSVEQECNTI